jgi:muramoyltetrapeptide carboxypeptidase
MQEPAPLRIGDKIGIISTASAIEKATITPAIELLKSKGFEIVTGEFLLARHHQFAGTDQQRAHDLQIMLDTPDIKAIICSRGGYGTLRTLQYIDWKIFLKFPKWIVGFSDVTVLHSQLHQLNIASIHGVMLGYFLRQNKPSESFGFLVNALEGEKINYTLPASTYNKLGKATGQVVGGNLSILFSLRGTPYDIDTNNKILFIEDLNEYLYHIDRIMLNLKTGGKLARLSALIVGGFTAMKDNETPFGKSLEEIILNAVEDYDYPVIFDFPAGHQINNFAIKLGCKAQISVTSQFAVFSQ